MKTAFSSFFRLKPAFPSVLLHEFITIYTVKGSSLTFERRLDFRGSAAAAAR